MINGGPTQFRQAFSGQADASGNLTVGNLRPSQGQFSAFTLIALASSGAPQWVLQVAGGGPPLGFAGGGKASIGAIYSYPTETLELVVSGAAPSADIRGSLVGYVADSPDQLPVLGLSGGSSSGGGGASGALPGGQSVVRGNLVAVNDAVAISCGGATLIGFGFANSGGLNSGSAIQFEGTNDDVNWLVVPVFQTYWQLGIVNGVISLASTLWVAAAAGLSQVRVRLTALGGGQASIPVIARATPIAAIPQALGSRPAAYSLPVALASDQLPISVASSPPTASLPTYWISAGNVTKAIGLGGIEQLLTLYHPATVAELIKVRKIVITIESNSAATILTVRLRRLNGTTAPSGGTAVVAISAYPSDAALSASDVFQTYPTTKGTVDTGAAAVQSWSLAISAAPTDITKLQPITLYSNDDAASRKAITARQNAAEGWAVEMNSSAASTVVASVAAEITVG